MTQNAKHRRPKPEPKRPKDSAQKPLNSMQQWLIDHNLNDDEESAVRLGLMLTVEQLFTKLSNSPDEVTGSDLFALSDLSRSEAEFVRDQWTLLPVVQRRKVVEQLIETAEEQLDLSTGEFLRIALRDEDAQVRRHAIDGLWEDEGEDLIGPYMQMMQSDPDATVQAAAAAALGSYVLLGELEELQPALAVRVEQSLFETLEDKSQPLLVQCRALESIAFSSDEGLRQLIEDAYYSPYEEMRLSSLRAMGRSSDVRWRKMAQAELQSPDAAMRAEAALACGELDHKAAIKELLGLLNDEEQIVRLSTIYALGHIGGKTARNVLRKIAASGESAEAEAAEEALEEMLFFADMAAMIEELQGVEVGSAMEEDERESLDAEFGSDEFDDDELDEDEFGLSSESLWDTWSDEESDAEGGELDDDAFDDSDDLDDDDFDDDDFDDDDFDEDKRP